MACTAQRAMEVFLVNPLGFLVNSETGHSEDRQPNLRHALGSVKRVKVRATGDLRAHPLEVVGHRPALPAFIHVNTHFHSQHTNTHFHDTCTRNQWFLLNRTVFTLGEVTV